MARVRTRSAQRSIAWLATAVVITAGGSALADEPSPTGKGIVGGALLGGEVVLGAEAALGVRSSWMYLAGGVVGGTAGGVGGYFVEHNATNSHTPIYMLAGGMALIIPTTVAVLSAASYRPPPDYQEDAGVRGTEPPADVVAPEIQQPAPAPLTPPAGTSPSQPPAGFTPPAGASGVTGPTTARDRVRRSSKIASARMAIPTSMVAMYNGSLRVGVPAVEVRPMYSAYEMRQYGVAQREEIRIPVFHAVF